MLGRTWAGGTPRPSATQRATEARSAGVLRAGALGCGGPSGASLAAPRSSGGGRDAAELPRIAAGYAQLPLARKVQMLFSPALSNAHVQLRGAFGDGLVILILHYLMLGHNPTHSPIAPVCCNM